MEKLLSLIAKKNAYEQEILRTRSSEEYFHGLQNEVEEVQQELKEKNQVYLEDELGDILWDYLNLLIALESEGKITDLKKVFLRAEIKYEARVEAFCK